jgi:hypothetical protein
LAKVHGHDPQPVPRRSSIFSLNSSAFTKSINRFHCFDGDRSGLVLARPTPQSLEPILRQACQSVGESSLGLRL